MLPHTETSSSSATPRAGWLLAGPPVEGMARFVATPQALQGWGGRQGCEWRLFRAGGGECSAWGLPPAAAMLGRGDRGIYLPFSSLLAAWLALAGPWGSTVLWEAAGSSQHLTLELQQRHKPRLCCCCCCCSGCSLAPGQVVTAFAAFSALCRALQLLQLAALRGLCCPGDAGHSCQELPWAVPWGGSRVTLPAPRAPPAQGLPRHLRPKKSL